MGKITFVIPYEEIGRVVKSTFQERNANDVYSTEDWQLEIVLAKGVQAIARREFFTDAIVARGVTAAALKRMNINAPIIDLPVSGYDILRGIKACQERFGARKIGIVGSHDMVYGAKTIEESMDVELTVVEVNDESDTEPSISMLKAIDIDAVIGGVMSTDIARRHGLNAVYIQTGREAVYHAINEAIRVASVRRQEQERAEQFRAILNYSSVGILAINSNGAINLINTAAGKLLDLRDESIGCQADRVLPELNLSSVLASGGTELDDVKTVNGKQLAVNKVPVVIGEQTVGAVATFQPITAIQELEGKIRKKMHYRGHVARLHFGDILGDSAAIKRTIATGREFSKVNSGVLIVGETGTGKEIFAQSIHNAGDRCNGPFVAVNCAALPANLLESELFGYAEGAFTGAARGGKIGLFELAHRGTIFLDEISELSTSLQGRLLRVLQEREIMRLGDERIIPIDVRIIAATNRDLRKMMQQGTFREDLYYRLDTLRLSLPALRDRKEDIEPLIIHFLKLYCVRFNKMLKEVSPAAIRKLAAYPWPGNVRELRNIVERLVVLSDSGLIDECDVMAVLPEAEPAIQDRGPNLAGSKKFEVSGAVDNNISVLLKALEASQYHYGKAAAMLGISRTTLWRRLKQQ